MRPLIQHAPCTANRDPQSKAPYKEHDQEELNIQKYLNKMNHILMLRI